jgi:hypothetical protein
LAGALLPQGREEVMAVLSFDVADLLREGVSVTPLPDETGRIIDGRALPSTFAEQLQRSGLDTSKPLRIVGVIARRADGAPGRYSIHFQQA